GVASVRGEEVFFAGGRCGGVVGWGRGWVGGTGSCPAVHRGVVSAAGVQFGAAVPAPDDHFAAGPYCRVHISASGRVDGAGSRPTIRAWPVSAAGVQKRSAPEDDFADRFNSRASVSSSVWVWKAVVRPTVRV